MKQSKAPTYRRFVVREALDQSRASEAAAKVLRGLVPDLDSLTVDGYFDDPLNDGGARAFGVLIQFSSKRSNFRHKRDPLMAIDVDLSSAISIDAALVPLP